MPPSEATPGALAANLVYKLPSILDPIDLQQVFLHKGTLEVELGCGDGSFLMESARIHPQRNFLGVERLLGRIRKLDRKGRRLGLRNLRGIRIECAYFLEYLLPDRSVAALHVYFPDPWPKVKHRCKRLINERFPGLATRVLAPGGLVYLRTDDPDYFEQMCQVFADSNSFTATDTPKELANVLTDFESDFHAKGIQTLRAAYTLAEATAQTS